MANRDMPFTDEEFYKELENLGISDVSSDTFEKMKEDLIHMIFQEKSSLKKVRNYSNSLDAKKSGSAFQTAKGSHNTESVLNRQKIRWQNTVKNNDFRFKSPQTSSGTSAIYDDGLTIKIPLGTDDYLPAIRYQNYDSGSSNRNTVHYLNITEKLNKDSNKNYNDYQHFNKAGRLNDYLPHIDGEYYGSVISPRNAPVRKLKSETPSELKKGFLGASLNEISQSSEDSSKMNLSSDEILRTDLRNNGLDVSTVSSLNSFTEGKLKRKVLSHKEGKPVVTEVLVDIPSVFSSCYPSSFNSTFSNDLSFKSKSYSSGSLTADSSPESLTPRSNVSRFASKSRKKKSDPVAMYNYYKKFWDNFKPPGEKNHDKLRWTVRDKMLDYSL